MSARKIFFASEDDGRTLQPLRTGVLLFLLALAMQFLVIIVLATLFDEITAPAAVYMTLFSQTFAVLFAFFFLLQGPAEDLASSGLTIEKTVIGCMRAIGCYILFLPFYFVVCWVNSRFIDATPQELVEQIKDQPEFLASPLFLATVCFLIPVMEEYLFRGILYPGLRWVLAPLPSVIISAAIFAALHDLSAFLPIFALGCLLAMIRERCPSLIPVVLIHGLHNSITLFTIKQVTAAA